MSFLRCDAGSAGDNLRVSARKRESTPVDLQKIVTARRSRLPQSAPDAVLPVTTAEAFEGVASLGERLAGRLVADVPPTKPDR